jgi:hypothetical protein
VNVLVTVILLAVLGVWWFAVYNRVLRLRERVRDAWRALEPAQHDDALRATYNAHVRAYNDALEAFPANIVALVAGFKPARHFEP